MKFKTIDLYDHEKAAIAKGIQTSLRRLVDAETKFAIEWMGGSSNADCAEPCTEFDFFGLMYDVWREDGVDMPPEWLVYCTEYPEEGVISIGQGYGAVGDRLVCGDLTLEITAVRIEQIKSITEADAVAEGCISTVVVNEAGDDYTGLYATEHYLLKLWDSIHGEGAWLVNPWVWVIEFRLLQGGVV